MLTPASKGYYSVLLDTRDANQKMYLDGYSANDIIPALMFNVTNLEFKTHFLIVTNEKNYNTTRFGCEFPGREDNDSNNILGCS